MNLHSSNFSFKSVNTDELKLTGYASVFDNLDHHNDIIVKGAFAESIAKHNQGSKVKLLWQHDQTKPIGVIDTLCEDNNGLMVQASINNFVTQGKEVIALIKQKAIDSFSIGFNVEQSELAKDGVRIITKANLWEISIVTFPANQQAKITQHNSINQIYSNNYQGKAAMLSLLSTTAKSIFII